jgi:hypothetical protein
MTVSFFNFQLIFAQCITQDKVLEVTDSIVLAHIQNNDVLKYFIVTENSYYKYKTNVHSSKIKKDKFLHKRKLKKNITEIWIQYYFNYPDIKGVCGYHWIVLNHNLESITEMFNFTFVPNFLLKNKPSYFLSEKEALEKSIKYFEQIGKGIKMPVLCYREKDYGYYYYVENMQDYKNDDSTIQIERIYIDAVKGIFYKREYVVYSRITQTQ